MKKLISVLLAIALLLPGFTFLPAIPVFAQGETVTTGTLPASDLLDDLMEKYTSFIVVKHKALGGSHYSYTEAVSDTYDANSPAGEELTMFRPGSQMVLVELEKSGATVTRTETVLIDDPTGVIRDPDISEDGTTVLFSWKKDQKADDYHLYEYDLITKKTRQLTFGLGVADTEPKYLPNGNIVFSSTRTVQTVDCYKTPVSNLYLCGPNGEDIVRVGYDQVHTTYPTVTDDGRVLYTRWDYNDRNQLYVQGVFQMFPDGTGQTELWGNGANFPTSLLHTRQIEGSSDKYLSIASGHHVRQAGKLVILDTSVDRNAPEAVTLVFPDGYYDKDASVDHYGEKGPQYKYPYSISEDQFLVSYSPTGWTSESNRDNPIAEFSIYLMDLSGKKINLVPGTIEMPASQIVPITTRNLFERASMVNYGTDTGTYYVGNVYEGEGMEGVKFGTAKYLRIVALDYRAFAIGHTDAFGTGSIRYGTADPLSTISTGHGAWDVKRVLGVVPIEEDGSALFKVPSETPVYFQVLDAEGQAIQSMRSWSTLMPGETFSCVGCHEDKNTVPPAVSTTTMAMAKGVQEIQPEPWQTGEGYEDFDPYENTKGFSYLEEIQPILDESCVECHNDQAAAFNMTDAYLMTGADTTLEDDDEVVIQGEAVDVIKTASTWQYFKSDDVNAVPANWNTTAFTGSWSTAQAPFGDRLSTGTKWADTTYIWIRYEFNITNAKSFEGASAILNTFYDDNPVFYLNGNAIFSPEKWVDAYTSVKIKEAGNYLVEGKNVLAIRCMNTSGGRNIDTALTFEKGGTKDVIEIFGTQETWKYRTMNNNSPLPSGWMESGYNDSAWQTGKAGFGNTGNKNTNWKGADTRLYLRKSFTLTKAQLDQISDKKLLLDIYFDQNPEVYINGVKVFSLIGWNSGYKEYTLTQAAKSLLKEGTNVIAMTAEDVNIYGYQTTYLDAGLYAAKVPTKAFSLEGRMMNSAGIVKEFPLSYLILTGSTSQINKREWVGSPENLYTNWISCMSQCEVLDPYQYGSEKSYLIDLLKGGHHGVELSDSDMRKIMVWIDLAVPAFGDYFEGNTWNNNQIRWADEYTAKREYYETMNEIARTSRALGDVVKEDISITYKTGDTTYSDVYDFSGAKKLELPTYYKAGDTLTVKLPAGEHYLGLTLDSLMGEAILYVPDGTYTFTVPEKMEGYNRTFKNTNPKTITARVVSAAEAGERYNLAKNPYDVTDLSGSMQVTSYPHATTDSNYGNHGGYLVRNAIDGVTANLLHGSYPSQSWGPDLGSDHWMKVDFGREVTVDQVVLTMRAHAGHDSYFKSGTLVFSDGTQVKINMTGTADKQTFSFAPVSTSYVLLTDLVAVDLAGKDDWAAITEFEVYGNSDTSTEAYKSTDVYVNTASGSDTAGDGSQSNPFKTVAKAIDAKKNADFSSEEAIRVFLTGEEQNSTALLFGESTIFNNEGNRLPIIIEGQNGAGINLASEKTAAANSYFFKNLTLTTPPNASFFAGSGEVVFENVTFSDATTSFFGDDFASSGAFAAWDEVKEGTVTSITFGKGVSFDGTFAAVGGETTENSSKIVAKAVVCGSKISSVKARVAEGVAIKESAVEIYGGATVDSVIGIHGGNHTGDLVITVGEDKKDTTVVKELISAKGDYSLDGYARLNIVGGTLGDANETTAIYTTAGAAAKLGTVNTITGGTLKGGFIGAFTTGNMTSVGNITNNVTGGVFPLSFVGGSAGVGKSVVIPKVVNNIGGNANLNDKVGTFTDESGKAETVTFSFVGASFGSGAIKVKEVVNNFSGSADIQSGFGGARVFNSLNSTSDFYVEEITNNFSGAQMGYFYAGSRTGGAVKKITNLIANTKIATFFGGSNSTPVKSGSDENVAIENTIGIGANVTNFYGGSAAADVQGKIVTTVNGGNVAIFYAGSKGGTTTGEVETLIKGGNIQTLYSGSAGATHAAGFMTTVKGGTVKNFYGAGIGGSTAGETRNLIEGGTFTKFVAGSAGEAAGVINTTIPQGSTAVFEKSFTAGCEKGSATENTVTISGGTLKGTTSGSGITLSTEEGSPLVLGTLSCDLAVGGEGALKIGKDAFVSAKKISGTLKLYQAENWVDEHKYFFAEDLSEGEVAFVTDENKSAGTYGISTEEGFTVFGVSITPVGAKLVLDTTVGVKLYFNKSDVDAIGERFTYSVKVGKDKAAEGGYNDLASEGIYYVLSFYGIGLSDFDTDFQVLATGFYDENEAKYNSIVKLSELGAENASKLNHKMLYQSIADLGRVVNDPNGAKYDLGYTKVTPAPKGEKGEAGALLTFTGKNLLMKNALGIRLYGSSLAAEDLSDMKIVVNGADVTSLCDVSKPTLSDGKYNFTVDIFIAVSKMQTLQNITIYDGAGKVCLKLSDRVDWIAQTIVNKESENNLAKSIYIYIQKVYNYVNDIQTIVTPPAIGEGVILGEKVPL